MRTKFVLALLLLCLSASAFAAPKNAKETPTSGILISAPLLFNIVGDGISASITITPWKVQGGQSGGNTLPILPLAGVLNGNGSCFNGPTFTATTSGKLLTVTFPTPPESGQPVTCSVNLLFQPQ